MVESTEIIESIRKRPVMYVGNLPEELSHLLILFLNELLTNTPRENIKLDLRILPDLTVEIGLWDELVKKSTLEGLLNKDGGLGFAILLLAGLGVSFTYTNSSGSWEYAEGLPVRQSAASTHEVDVKILFKADEVLLGKQHLNIEVLAFRLKELSCFFPNHIYELKSELTDKPYHNRFSSIDGLIDLFYFSFPFWLSSSERFNKQDRFFPLQSASLKDEANGLDLQIVLMPSIRRDTIIVSYVNYNLSPFESSHIEVLKKHFAERETDEYDITNGYLCLVSLHIGDHFFYTMGTKESVGSPLLDALMLKAIGELR